MTDDTKNIRTKIKYDVLKSGLEMLTSGLVVGSWGNISCRVPDSEEYVITPSGKSYQEMTIDDLVVMNLAGEVVDGKNKPSTEYHLHLYIYRAHNQIRSIVHTHSIFASAHAVARVPVKALVEDHAMLIGGNVEVAEYAPPGTAELAKCALAALGDRWAVLLANHGAVGMGRNLGEAMLVSRMLEKSAQISIASRALGSVFELDYGEANNLRNSYLTSYGKLDEG